MIFNAHKYTQELLLRYGMFNAGDILLVEHFYSPQGTCYLVDLNVIEILESFA